MPTCSLCESSQPAGEQCDVCGRAFPAAQVVALPVPALPELEPTQHAALAGDVPVSPFPDLEPTSAVRGAIGAAAEPLEGFSPTLAEPVEVDVTPLEVERVGEGASLDPPSEPGPVTCRYCRTPATPGERLCGRCGMRLPLARSPAAPQGGAAAPCRDCGIPATGSQCPACGARH